jgi:hypothetical protein
LRRRRIELIRSAYRRQFSSLAIVGLKVSRFVHFYIKPFAILDGHYSHEGRQAFAAERSPDDVAAPIYVHSSDQSSNLIGALAAERTFDLVRFRHDKYGSPTPLIKATEGGFHFRITRKLPAFSLSETLGYRGQIRCADLFGFTMVSDRPAVGQLHSVHARTTNRTAARVTSRLLQTFD